MHGGLKAALAGMIWAVAAGCAGAEEWSFQPRYDLPRNAATLPAAPRESRPLTMQLGAAPLLFGDQPTESRLLSAAAPSGDLSVELWVLDHVNQPVGVLLSVGDVGMAYHQRKAAFGALSSLQTAQLEQDGYKEYWRHLIVTRRGDRYALFVNGVAAGDARAPARAGVGPIRIDGYFANEPFMELGNLVQAAAVEPRALSADEVKARFDARRKLVDDGRLAADRFHFTQSPYLNMPQMDSIELSFEFDRGANATVEYGETEASLKRIDLDDSAERLHGVKLTGLRADTPYFYRVRGVAADGAAIDSGLLSFRTAPPPGRPFTFVVTGDTEARPHINNRVSQLIWQERPSFISIMGDLTDGGGAQDRFEWTHEYFLGMGPLFGRVPSISPVGNGEEELKWYRHYHRTPAPENYYSLVYGDVEFFVLDSNIASLEEREPGSRARQRAWLERALASSKAKWKIAYHHHDVRTSDEDDYGNTWKEKSSLGDRDVQSDFLPLYEKYKVDMVFFGHLHSYERSWPIMGDKVDFAQGVTYVQVGGAGGNLEDFSPNKPWFSRRTFRAHHFATVSVGGDAIEVRVVDIDGNQRDAFTVRKGSRQ